MNAKTLRQFDDSFTRLVWGYRACSRWSCVAYPQHPLTSPLPTASVDDYYNDASSINYLRGVRVPLLVLEAEDDPIIPATVRMPP